MAVSQRGATLRHQDGVAVVELLRPALNVQVKQELLEAVRQAGQDGAARAVLIAGGTKAFCVGQDLAEHAAALAKGPEAAFATVRAHYNPLIEAVQAIRVPVVAAVEGACVGAGLGLALAADLRVAAEGAKFATAFTGIALAADSGLSGTLARLAGPSRAAGLMLLGERFTAADAERWGLVHQVVADGTATEAGLAMANRLAHGPTQAYREVKALLKDAATADPAEILQREADAQTRLGATRDHQAAVHAFLAKEQPRFSGR
ncbi:enoyl-CoA hydratase/isomerase family protein [Streptomyces sp. V3I7]|uniref:enoyl-CoA hydratase/isomerase family protein n=1 Tax=Streptomyces sp. V3I7 TaxID=3042278 RepID=UPI00278A2331|nr:enoyl-CoA hydratase-related protein [Streptomyces sp. V3I7]MDQ0992766.1 2-(1,2-epoxy-1,2-dihydrophenyl)acetyl-CoA isomerase [Streptomyces sp. V3I7]